MEQGDLRSLGHDLPEIVGNLVAEGYISAAATQEILCQGSVEEPRLMGDDIVKDRNDLAMLFQPSGDVAKRRSEIGHPVTYDHQIRFPVPDRPVGPAVGKRISRIQESLALDGYGIIVLGYVLGLPGKKEARVLPLEIERLDRVFLSQFQVETCVELRNPSSERVETGKERDSQVIRPWCLCWRQGLLCPCPCSLRIRCSVLRAGRQ